ncbi:RsfA family transcriptional regulator [Metabacillus fastidiosus]|uniref:RsfA family transcriptional regulator n=1 Tax=Metabacillus fastidiosus TaxID=1458 RepID=A0ABU6NYE9_9BACI|nr:RsfA family transcriptional regulator [Metabacillus fastidiosus]MEC2074711.1 RsfA family transcriptional regulator [Metabacillus fastidiosus]MED4401683.1 RsfA family transcriptional regulator [Metabacillus fastidiosus]MED4452757.1 RsfA family transcriptional regulator [Metabacillus fastidiosus]MED4463322.1 RsfA family transcriptional regulator [Metabacillus fastidiosus]MED4532665.1 RsfA family transcriptional regulator [Metabacillus fastidiosus]
MTATRQDAWSHDEDLLLAEVVLRHIRDGGTQLAAFEEVGKKLSRTAAACGFRWNSSVRKQYKTGIELAKKQRKELRKQLSTEVPDKEVLNEEPVLASDISLKEVIVLLQQYENMPSLHELKRENEQLVEKVAVLEKEVEKLEQEKRTFTDHIQVIEEDYHALIEIMDRARKMVVFQEDERSRKVKFQMDRNGNLERVEK